MSMSELAAELPDWEQQSDRAEREATAAHDEEVHWVSVASAVGTPNAVIIAGRLESYDIPTRVTQEAAGVHAIAVTVGLLGTARVWVPEEYREQAEEILATDAEEEE
jgi:hypothetical protein